MGRRPCTLLVMSQRGIVLFGMMAVIWGIPYLFIRVAVAEITPATLVFARTALGALILLPIAIARVDLRLVLARWPWLVAFAVIEIAIPWLMLGTAEQRISSSLTGLLLAGVPLVGTVLALATGGVDRTSRMSAVGLLVGLVGVGAIVGADFASSDAAALAEVGVVVVCYAIGPAILARRLGGLPSVGVMSLALGLTALIYLPFAATQVPAVVPSPKVFASIGVLAVICTALGFIVFAALIKEIGPVRSTVITYVNPAVAAALGILVLNETFSLAMGVGLLLVISGSILATRRPAALAANRPPTHEPISAATAGSSDG
jgi:drug/metabolite transporter (DMT)-like permease